MTVEESRLLATKANFLLWDTGGGNLAFVKHLRGSNIYEGMDGDGRLDIGIAFGPSGGSVNAAPGEKQWYVAAEYFSSTGNSIARYADNVTLPEAIAKAAEFEADADMIWEQFHGADRDADNREPQPVGPRF